MIYGLDISPKKVVDSYTKLVTFAKSYWSRLKNAKISFQYAGRYPGVMHDEDGFRVAEGSLSGLVKDGRKPILLRVRFCFLFSNFNFLRAVRLLWQALWVLRSSRSFVS